LTIEQLIYRGKRYLKHEFEALQTRNLRSGEMLLLSLKLRDGERLDAVSIARPIIGILLSFEKNNIRYAIVGHIASVIHGRPLVTADVDLLIDYNEKSASIISRICSRNGFHVLESDLVDALKDGTHVTGISKKRQPIRLDLIPAFNRSRKEQLNRRRKIKLLGKRIYIASNEDLIAYFIVFDRLDDVRFMLEKYHKKLDMQMLKRICRELNVARRLSQIVKQVKNYMPR